MNNVYIDLGCFDGDSVEQFRNWRRIAFPGREDWKIYAFDPNPRFAEAWQTKKDQNTSFTQLAAWVEDGTAEFAVSDNPLGSTLMPGKKKVWDTSEKIEVDTFDFSKWLESFAGDFVVVKMDIEGAEFPILKKMLKDSTYKIVDVLMVEFHPNKVVEYTTTSKIRLIRRLKDHGVNILEWH